MRTNISVNMDKKAINERKAAEIAQKLQDGTFWETFPDYGLKELIAMIPPGCIEVWEDEEWKDG
jgi:hypothetical protein